MRIIDKNHDYYDYLADPTDTLVFDRRGSFMLSKKLMCERMALWGRRESDYRHLLLQCGATFWVFMIHITEWDDYSFYTTLKTPSNYEVELLATWKNYNKPNKLLDIRLIHPPGRYIYFDFFHNSCIDMKKINPNDIKTAIDYVKEFDINNSMFLGHMTVSPSKGASWDKKTYTIPLLSACGIADVVSPVDMFCAIEEYFSIEKTKAERTEPLGITNDDKITMHGFDTKSSFRGKRKK